MQQNEILAAFEQPMPTGDGEPVNPSVVAYLVETGRMTPFVAETLARQYQKGMLKYKSPLKTNNGRSFLRDLRGELADGLQYVEGELMEREKLEALLIRTVLKYVELQSAVDSVMRAEDIETAHTMLEYYAKRDVADDLWRRIAEFLHELYVEWMADVKPELSKAKREVLREYGKEWGKLEYAFKSPFLDKSSMLIWRLIEPITSEG